MTRYTIAVLPGDGIGPEVTAEALRVLQAAAELFGFGLDAAEYAVGAAGVAEAGDSLPPRTADAVVQADAVLLGAVGHPSSPRPKAGGAPRRGCWPSGRSLAPTPTCGRPPCIPPCAMPPRSGPSAWKAWTC